MANGEEHRSLAPATRAAATVALRPGACLELHGSAAAWRVEEGTAELYVESTSEAWREYLFAVSAGEVVLGFPAAEGLRVVAAGRSSATLRPLDGGEAISRTAATAWLGRLSAALERFAPAVDFIDEVVQPPARLRPETGKRITGTDDIVWIKLCEGRVALLDRVEIAATSDPCFLPLRPGIWLTTTSDARLEVVRWEELDEVA
jgi:hypothetical protein